MIRIQSLIRFSKILDSDQSTDLLDQNIPLSGLNRVRLYPDYGGIILLQKCVETFYSFIIHLFAANFSH